MRPATVSIVIPTFEGRELLARHLPSVVSAAARVDAEVLVVDDGSRDGTVDFLRACFPAVTVVAVQENRGFSVTMNRGIRASRGEIVVSLNNDVSADEDFLAPLLAHFDDPACFAVAARMLTEGGTINESLIRGTFRRGALEIHRFQLPPGDVAGAVPVLCALGAAVAYSREKFIALGGFDELFSPFNGEDLDLSYRAMKRGWAVWWEPASVVRHDHRATIGRLYSRSFIRQTQDRARLLFTWKNITDPAMFAAHLVTLGPRMLFRLARGEGHFVRALLSCLRDLPAIVEARRREKRHTVRSDREVFALVVPFSTGDGRR